MTWEYSLADVRFSRWVLIAWLVARAPVAVIEAAPTPQYTLATWTARDGLPSSYVISLAQDRDGYLWVGTSAGLARFDGRRFVTWPRNQNLPSPTPLVYSVTPTRDGGLWIVFGGLSRIAHDSGGRATTYTTQDGLPEGGMRALVQRQDGTVWAGGSGGLCRFTNGRWEPVPLPDNARAVVALAEDREGHLWVGTSRGVYRSLDPEDGFTTVRTGVEGVLRFAPGEDHMAIAGEARVATVSLDLKDIRVARLTAEARTGPFPIMRDRAGHIWAGTNGEGLFRIDEHAERAPASLLHYTERNGLAGDQIRVVLEDRDGNIWVGTQAGLTRITEASIAAVTTRAGATSENISTLVADVIGNVWVEVPGGLARISGTERTVFTSQAGARFNTITALFADAQGGTWIASGDGRVTRFANGAFQPVARHDASTSPIIAITADADGRVWLYDGRYFSRRGVNAADSTVIEAPPELRVHPFRFLHVDRRGRLWAGTDGGLVAMRENGSFHLFGAAEGVPYGQLSGILEDARGRIWIGSDSGLSTFEDGRLVTLTTRNGLPGDRIFFAIEDRAGYIWLGVGTGIARVAPDELAHAAVDAKYRLHYRLCDSSDGLRGTPVLRGTPMASRAPDGSIWFVTTTGIAVIDPTRLHSMPSPPIPHLEPLTIDGRATTAAEGLEVPPRVSSLQIEYSALNLTSPSKVRFRHRLDNVDANWVDDGENAHTVYANLPPGSYRFHLAASNGDDVWSTQPVVWAFTVLPTWYQTRAFYIAAVAVALVLMWSVWQLRMRQMHQQFSVVLAERARVGREIHDTLLQSLVGMALQLDNLSSQLDAPAPSLQEELARMRRQVEHYIEEAQQSIWELRAPRGESRDLASMLRECGERLTGNTGVRFAFSTTGTPRRVARRVEQQILRIAQEAVVNAVRHGQPQEVRMALAYEEKAVRLRVADDGRGFDTHTAGAQVEGHWGMSIMRERAEQIGGSFAVSSAPDHGTRIDIVAPAEA